MQVWRKRHFMLKGRELWYEKGDRGVSIVFFVACCIVYVCFVVKNLRIDVHMTDLKTVQERRNLSRIYSVVENNTTKITTNENQA